MPRRIVRNFAERISRLTNGIFEKPAFGNTDLFRGDDVIFKQIVKNSNVYAEYGCGESTTWVYENTNCEIYATDSSSEWLQFVESKCGHSARLHLHHSDIGRIGEWGWPLGYEKAENFPDYTDWLWGQNINPDVVLIDGRFRVCCFLTSLLNAKQETILIFDDYTNREHYHFVERFIQPTEYCGDQAIFRVLDKTGIDEAKLKDSIERFRYVME